jgi:hypothetical protein
MKKNWKVKTIASAVMAYSMLASAAMAETTSTAANASAAAAAPVKTSADFKDLTDVDASLKAKVDDLLAKGVFEGVSSDSFGITQNMTRAQFAKVLDLIYGAKVDLSLKTSGFADVKAEDAANGWAIPYIEAAKKAGMVDGKSADSFDPAANVTLGELATALVKGLGVKPDTSGNPWYADAVKQAVSKNLLPTDTDGSRTATRSDLAAAAYAAQKAYADANMPDKVSITSVKATGVKTVVVSFDTEVDTTKATLTLAKGAAAVSVTAKFADDKKSATLTLTDTKLKAGDYTVTLGGLDASAIKTSTGTFTAQDETLQKLEFVTTSDTIADAKNVVVKLKATNQYGENASFSPSSYTIMAGNNNDVNPRLGKASDGSLQLRLDTSSLTGKQENVSVIPVNIWFNDTHLSASKNFTLGMQPFVTKLELGDVSYTSGKAINKQGETATFNLNLYDQYGSLIGRDSDAYKDSNVQAVFSPYEANLKAEPGNWDASETNTPQVRVSLKNDVEKSGDYNVQVLYQGASAQTKISVKSAAIATKVEIGEYTGSIAAGDMDIYIPIIAYDANGTQLSTDDLVSDTNLSRINITVSGADYEPGILRFGGNKGMIHLKKLTTNARGIISVTAYIATAGVSSTATKTLNVGPVRVPDHLIIATEPAKYIVPGAYSGFSVQAIDQYGSSMDSSFVTDSNGNLLMGVTDPSRVTGNVYYYATLTPINLTPGKTWISENSDGAGMIGAADDYDASAGSSTFKHIAADANGYGLKNDHFDTLNNTYRLYTAPGATGSFGFTAKLFKVGTDGKESLIDSVTRTTNLITSNDSLSYNLGSVPALFNAIGSGIIATTTYDGVNQLTDAAQKDAKNGKFGREVTFSAVNAAGDAVAILSKQITGIQTSNSSVVQAVYSGGQAFVIGNGAGTATVVISFKAADGTIRTLSSPVTVKSDSLVVDHISAGNTGVQTIGLSGSDAWNVMDVQVYDNYGDEYEKTDALKYNYLFGVTFSVAHIKAIDSSKPVGRLNIDQYGNITITKMDGSAPASVADANVASFELTAVSASGKSSASTPVQVK